MISLVWNIKIPSKSATNDQRQHNWGVCTQSTIFLGTEKERACVGGPWDNG